MFDTESVTTPRIVFVKGTYGLAEMGIGSVGARLVWESDPDESGAFAHLARAKDGTLYLSITDMEEHGGSYVSVPITTGDLSNLMLAVTMAELVDEDAPPDSVGDLSRGGGGDPESGDGAPRTDEPDEPVRVPDGNRNE